MNKPYDAAELRAALHAMPELAMQEKKTQAYVLERLREAGIEAAAVDGTTGVLGVIRGAEPGPVVMLRADMDALPFTIDGKPCAIHACGHDGHMAMLLAAASRLTGRIKKGTLKLLFQPAEEKLLGAPAMIAAHVLDDVDILFGAHIRPIQDVPEGRLCAAVRHTASSTAFVKIEGKSAHASRPHLGVNAIDAAVGCISAVSSIWLNPNMSWSAKATQIHADAGATNTVPAAASITFDVRAQTNELMSELKAKMKTAVENAAAACGAKASIDFPESCPAAVYDEDLVAVVAEAIKETFGAQALAPDCGGGGEDFHCYKMAKPSLKTAYFGVGVGAAPGLHDPKMDFNPKALDLGVKLFEVLSLRYLG